MTPIGSTRSNNRGALEVMVGPPFCNPAPTADAHDRLDDRAPRNSSQRCALRGLLELALRPGELEDGDDADSFGLLCVVGEAGVATGLLGVDPVALVAGELANGDRVAVGSALDRARAGGREVVVPVGVGRCPSLGGEHVDG